MMSIETIRKTAQDVLSQNEMIDRFPVPIVTLANITGFNVKAFTPSNRTDDVSGIIYQKTKTIYINGKYTQKEQYFGIAVFLGYIVLHQEKEDLIKFKDSNKPKDLQAKIFAEELLMEKKRFLEVYSVTKSITEISDYFAVEPIAILLRLNRLNITSK